MSETSAEEPTASQPHAQHEAPVRPRWSVYEWAWFIVKNLIGWVLMLLAFPLGMAVPGPGGLPIFIIGFALVSFPGKRHLTARVLRGIPVSRQSRGYRWFVALFAIIVPAGVLSWLINRWLPPIIARHSLHPEKLLEEQQRGALALIVVYACTVTLLWVFGLRGVHIINLGLKGVARVRRKIRPWMRRKGMDLLPPRRRKRMLHGRDVREIDHGILEIHERHQARFRAIWAAAKPWLRRSLGLAVTLAIFYWMFKPVYLRWGEVKKPLADLHWGSFFIAMGMFAAFLLIFRVLPWWRVLASMGHRLPLAATTRIFCTSELARYLPGWIWQVMGRVYLIKPYGVRGSICSTSQILELVIFLLANILVAISCLLFLAGRMHPQVRALFWGALAVMPVLLLLLHPSVFYGIVNKVMRRLGKPEIADRLKKRQLTYLGLWAIAGLLWQSLAIWLIVSQPLGLPLAKWWVVAGAYCLAWSAGFLAFWAPGGLGVREAVLVLTLELAMPPAVVRELNLDLQVRLGLYAFLGVLLRLWTIGGELLLTAAAYAADYKGALNRPDAPGRVRRADQVCDEEPAPAQGRVSVG